MSNNNESTRQPLPSLTGGVGGGSARGESGVGSFVRPNIWKLTPYSCARDEFKGRVANVFLDANENPYNAGFNRYPDPLQEELKEKLSVVKEVPASRIFLGNGSDEAIDLVYRIFCEPRQDNVVAISPTYGMYGVCADINDVEYRPVELNEDFSLDADRLLAACFRLDLDRFPNLIVLNTFSKLWASAAIRLGMAFASEEIIALFNKVKYPYNVNQLTQQQAMKMLADIQQVQYWRATLLREREHLLPAVAELPICKAVYPTDANFFLARMTDADSIYRYLIDRGIVVRNRSRVQLCGNCLRITIGTPQENNALLGALRQYK